ncbi:hypothetical protein FNF29_01959 [Cafeteria roenbergensis]|uniref:Uncharacterized protein n=1 Tax=Cafeteria roenbergensis TaxID=33653 RepID=A0A5A8CR62_CAFRO|nr:hypothetical protein FNF29_01959 [Cafeteria roenbergensis]|eukprot:KAA0155209.1 hypothetical protein FNF29_01959 [Cafeteria roenbergensis]
MARALAAIAVGLLASAALAATLAAGAQAGDAAASPLGAEADALRLIEDAEREHGIIVDHLTHRLLTVTGGTTKHTPAEDAVNIALAAEPIFLQLEHAVRSHVQRVAHVARHGVASKVHARAEVAAQRAGGFLMTEDATDTSCFACLYLMQKVLAETEPYNSPAVQAGTAAAMSEEARRIGSGARGVPIQRPMASAYQSRNLPNNDPEPPNGTPLLSPPTAMNGWAQSTSPLLFHGSAGHPVTNPWAQFRPRDEADAEEVEKHMPPEEPLPGLDPALWPELDMANTPAEEEKYQGVAPDDSSSSSEEDEDEGGDEEDEDSNEGEEEEEGEDSNEEEEANGGEEAEDENDGGDSFLQTAAARAPRARGPAAFLQARARARFGSTSQEFPPSPAVEDVPVEAYMQYTEPPAIGPRIPPPVQDGGATLGGANRPLTFNKHNGAIVMAMGDDTERGPPMLAPQALVRALEAGRPTRFTTSLAGTLDDIVGNGVGPMLVPELDANGAVVTDEAGAPRMRVADVEDKMAAPFPRPDPDAASLLQRSGAAAAPVDTASFLQAASAARSRGTPPSAEEMSFPGSFFADVPEGAYFAHAHPPMIGPNVPPPLPRVPGKLSGDRVWGDAAPGTPAGDLLADARGPEGASPFASTDEFFGAPASQVGSDGPTFSGDLMQRTPDGGIKLRGAVSLGNPPQLGGAYGDVHSQMAAPLSGVSAGGPFPAPIGPRSFLQERAAAGLGSGAGGLPERLPGVATATEMAPAASGVHAGVPGLQGAVKGDAKMPEAAAADLKAPGVFAQMIHSAITPITAEPHAPDLDFPALGVDAVSNPNTAVEVKGDKLVPVGSLLQRGAAAAAGKAKEAEDSEGEAEEESDGQQEDGGDVFHPQGEEPGEPRDLAAGLFTPPDQVGKPRDRAAMSAAFHADRNVMGARPGLLSEGIDHPEGLTGLTGPSHGCTADEVDGSGKQVAKGQCPSGTPHERVADKAGEQEVFGKYTASRGRADSNWPTPDGIPVHAGESVPGVEPVLQKTGLTASSAMAAGLKALPFGKKKEKPYAAKAPEIMPHGLRGTSTGGGEVGPRFGDWLNPDAGLFSKPRCTTENFNDKPTDLADDMSDPASCYHTSWLAHHMTDKVIGKMPLYGPPAYGTARGSSADYERFAHPARTGAARFAERDAAPASAPAPAPAPEAKAAGPAPSAAADDVSLLQAVGGNAKAGSRLASRSKRVEAAAKRHAPRAAPELGELPRLAEAGAASQAGLGGIVDRAREAARPLPHSCRTSDGGLCRQRLRAPTPWQMRRTFRRMMMQSRSYALSSKWTQALRMLCTALPPLGQPRPPVMEGSGTWGSNGASSGIKAPIKKPLGMLNFDGAKGIKNTVHTDGPKGGIDDYLRRADKIAESGYEGPRPPPRLQSEGLASNGKVESQPFTGYVREPTPYGDHPAVGQMMDMGMPPMLASQCDRLSKKLEMVADLYLHAYDMEETCTEIKMCKGAPFGITTSAGGTSSMARMFEATV